MVLYVWYFLWYNLFLNMRNPYVVVCKNGRFTYEHILVMENILGRKLTKDEVVHHINHNPKDNRAENLVVLTRSEHMRIHSYDKFGTPMNLDKKQRHLLNSRRSREKNIEKYRERERLYRLNHPRKKYSELQQEVKDRLNAARRLRRKIKKENHD